jgi:curved DNA-binding protein CbpA
MNKIVSRSFCEQNKLVKEFLNKDFYSLLNVVHNASDTEIRKSYYQLAKKYHPDKFKGPVEIFRKLTEAYHTLKDSSKRELYNTKLKIKIRKSGGGTPGGGARTTSIYEDDFKKLDIDKLFYQFNKKKFRLQADEIKIFKPVLERKMSRREYMINEFFNRLREDESKSKSLRFAMYKKVGYIKEDEEIAKPYDEMVKEEIEKIKNKQTAKEDIKKQKEEDQKSEELGSKHVMNLLYYVAAFYTVSFGFVMLIHYLRKRKMREIMLTNIKIKDRERLRGYQFFG